MATGLSSPLGFAGVLMIIIGIILAVAGIIALVAMANQTKPWWVWFLLIGGIVIGIIGGILLAIALSSTMAVVTPVVAPVVAPAPVVVPAAPACAPQHQMVYTQPAPQPVVYAQPAPQPVVYTQPAPQPVVYAQPTPQPVVYAQPAPAPVPAAVPAALPLDSVSSRQYAVGASHFNPDPLTYHTYTPGTQTRIVAEGNYGPGGERVRTPGVLTTPATLTETNYDVGDHPVVVQPGSPVVPQAQVAAAVVPRPPIQYYQQVPQTRVVQPASPRYVAQPAVVAQPVMAPQQGQLVLASPTQI